MTDLLNRLFDLWQSLCVTPLFGVTVTLLAYQAAVWLHRRSGQHPLCNPVLLAIAIIIPLLLLTGTDYATYFASARPIHLLLGPATVALAVPLYRQTHLLRRSLVAVIVAVGAGSLTAIGSAVGFAWLLGAPRDTLLSLAPKSVTTPIAMGIAEKIGGIPSLTAGLVILTGILGAVIGRPLLHRLGVKDWAAQGLAIGVTSHGIGTARALQTNDVAGAFAGLGMGLNGLVTAIILPILVLWVS